MVRKRRNQKVIPTPKTEVGKSKLTIRYFSLVSTLIERVMPMFIIMYFQVRNVYTICTERKTENLLQQNLSHRVSHKFKKKQAVCNGKKLI